MPSERIWNWQQEDWPQFHYDTIAVEDIESNFLLQGGVLRGVLLHLSDDDKSLLTVDLISTEALKTSEI